MSEVLEIKSLATHLPLTIGVSEIFIPNHTRMIRANRIFIVLSLLLNLEIVRENRKFRLFNPENQEFLLTAEELKAELEKRK